MHLSIYAPGDYPDTDLPLLPVLRPFFARENGASAIPWHQANIYQALWQQQSALFTLVDNLQDADLVVLPIDWYWVRGYNWRSSENRALKHYLIDLYAQATDANKRVVAFFTGDRSCEEIPVNNALVFRESAYRSRIAGTHSFSLPAFVEDFVSCYTDGVLQVRTKQLTPVIGFCGLSNKLTYQHHLKHLVFLLYMLVRSGRLDVSPYKGELMRDRILAAIRDSDCLAHNLIVRTENTFIGVADETRKMQLRREYVQNMLDSDYVLCCRGSGNFSYRLYETLCMGRIPVVVDTDLSLPFDHLLDWRKHVVWVPEDEIDRLPELVSRFHQQLSPGDFEQLQRDNRQFWQEWLSPLGFFQNFYRFLE